MMTPAPPLRIEPGERNSPLWQKLKAAYEQRLVQLREENDGDLLPDHTAKVRGKIAAVKELLELDTDRPMR